MSRLVLVEDPPEEFGYRKGDEVIATSAVAAYELERRRIPHRLLDDCYSERELLSRQKEHWKHQLRWLRELDDALQAVVPSLVAAGTRLGTLYGRWLKGCLDSVFIRGFQLEAVLSESGAEQACLFPRSPRRDGIPANLTFHDGESLFALLLPEFAPAAGLDWEIAERPVESRAARPGPVERLRGLKARGRESFERARIEAAAVRSRGDLPMTLLLLYRRYDLAELAGAAARRGHRCLVADADRVHDLGTPLRGRGAAVTPRIFDHAVWRDAALSVTAPESGLWTWPDSWFSASVDTVLRPRLMHWIEHIAPEVVAWADSYAQFCQGRSVDALIAPFLSTPRDFGAAEGARRSGTARVLIEHGDALMRSEAWDFFSLVGFDHYFAPDKEMAEHFVSRRSTLPAPTATVHCGSYHNRRNARIARARNAGPRRGARRPVVAYAPTSLAGDARYLNNFWYPDTWYFGLVRQVISTLASDDRFRTVVKLFPNDHAEHPIDRYVGELEVDHVEISREPLTDWLPVLDRLILDLPSTGMYEAAAANVPAMTLMHETYPSRPSGLARFAPSIARFSTYEDAVHATRRFLDHPHPPVPSPAPYECDDILATLEKIVGRENAIADG